MIEFRTDYPEGYSYFFSQGAEDMVPEDSLKQTIENLRAERAEYLAKIEEVDGLIRGLERRLDGKDGPIGPPTVAHNREFAGLGIAEAAVVMLKRANRPLHVREIADGLRAGGYEFRTDKPMSSIAPVLYMAAKKKRHGLLNLGKNTYSLTEITKQK